MHALLARARPVPSEDAVTLRARMPSWMVRARPSGAVAADGPRSIDITDVIDDVLPVMLKAPGEQALQAIASALSARGRRPLGVSDIGGLICQRPVTPVFDRLFDDPLGCLVLDEARRLIALLPSYDPSRLDAHNAAFSREFFAGYLRQSTIRVVHLIEHLRAAGMTGGAVLEVGALFGQFATALKRAGYDVTVVDRYRSQNGAFDEYVRYFRELGIRVVEADRDDEAARIASLGRFDAVISMAVVEHIPHTPREFLTVLASHVRPDGVLALDTPNIARFWNRKRINDGLSIHQDLATQFFCDVPYEGHHREYTAAEVAWMLEQVGCRDVRTALFDYNLLQFAELGGDHLDALLTMTIDPTLADTILAIGRVP
jgi:2-polyprenyl-3-methyl-5-hydroxy-6-metoxy-1,4-benzoquinol methylase